MLKLLFIVSLIVYAVVWYKRRKIRQSVDNCNDDITYQHLGRMKRYIGMVVCISFVLATVQSFKGLHSVLSEIAALLVWVALISFIVLWRKKRAAKKAAGENYLDDVNYQLWSKYKRWAGIICIGAFLIVGVTMPNDPPKGESDSGIVVDHEANAVTAAFNRAGVLDKVLANGGVGHIDKVDINGNAATVHFHFYDKNGRKSVPLTAYFKKKDNEWVLK